MNRTCPTCDGSGHILASDVLGVARCSACGRSTTVTRDEDGYADLGAADTFVCQGALNDAEGGCTVRMCRQCVKECDCCGLNTCPDHLKPVEVGAPDLWCDICRNAADRAMTEPEIEEQSELHRLATLSASGMSLTEAQLYTKHIDHTEKEPS